MKKKLFIFFPLVLTAICLFSQNSEPIEKKPSVSVEWAGHIALAKDLKSNIFLNVGGPTIKLGIGKAALNIGFCPSLKYNYEYEKKTDKTPLSPILGTGLMVSKGHFIAGVNFYSIKNIWYTAPALGYKFK